LKRKLLSILVGLLMVSGLVATATPAQAQAPLIDDYTDAPESYGSANHGLLSTAIPIWMGDIVLGFDPDFTDQPSVGAIDDDCNTVEGGIVPIPVSCLPAPLNIVNDLLTDAGNFILDDEDGVNIGQLIPNQQTPISVEAIAPGFLDAWIDWMGDGTFSQPGDQIFNDRPLEAGPNALQITVPNQTTAGRTYARFRYASTPVAGPTGTEADGEVEDYAVSINQDFGDAPDNPNVATDFPTVLASNGARHRLTALKLGLVTDSEPDGASSPNALGDDANPVGGPDDEEGVTFSGPLVKGQNVDITIRSSHAAEIDAWADWNGDLDWSDPGEQIYDDSPVLAGGNTRPFLVPATATTGSITTRWRLSTDGVASFTGLAPDGEVEDHQVNVSPAGTSVLDFGDAPTPPYHTLLGDNGARHAAGALALGDFIDSELDGQPNNFASGDDLSGIPDDEDGIDFTDSVFVPGKTTTIDVESTGTAFLDGWIDANDDGDWDDNGEHVVDSEIVTACGDPDNNAPPGCSGSQEVDLTMPPGNFFGDTFARFRLSSGGTNAPEGFVPDGEVEDYHLDIVLECGASVIGNIELFDDLNCPGDGPDEFGLRIGADKTDIDLNGHTISGDGVDPDRGISLHPGLARADDVKIHDGSIVDFGGGIELIGHRFQMTNLTVERNHGHGIQVDGLDTLLLNGSVTNNEGDGINNTGHGLNIVTSTLSLNNGDGIQQTGNSMFVDRSSVRVNSGNGIIGSGGDATVLTSSVSQNLLHGISWAGQNLHVTESTINDNGGHGVDVVGNRARINRNPSISDNGGDGVRFNGDITFVNQNSEINHNGGDGVHALGGGRNFTQANIIRGNGDDGIDYERAAKGRISRNRLGRSNGNFAIESHARAIGVKNVGSPCRPASLCKR
jgi:hypothetical protein